MRYVKIPKPIVLRDPAGAPIKRPDGSAVELSLLELVRDTLGSRAEWRENDSAVGMYLDIVDALETAAPGEYAKLTDEQHEKLSQVMRAFEPAPQFSLPYMRLVRAVTSASKSPPEQAEGVPANGVKPAEVS